MVVVNRLEFVDIGHDASELGDVSLSPGPFKLLEECPAVKTACQRIARGQIRELIVLLANLVARIAQGFQHLQQLLLLLLELRDVGETREHAASFALLIFDWRGIDEERLWTLA